MNRNTSVSDLLSLKGVAKTKRKVDMKKVREDFEEYLASRHKSNVILSFDKDYSKLN